MLTLLPAAYREQRVEEMLSTLLDGAGEGRCWPHAAEAASVATLATRLRIGAPGGTRNSAFYGEVLRRVVLGGLLLQVLVNLTSSIPIALEFKLRPMSAYSGWPTTVFWAENWTWFAGRLLVVLACFLALACGLRRTGRVLGVVQGAMAVFMYAVAPDDPSVSDVQALLALSLLTAVAALFGFHRDAPRTPAGRRWLGVGALLVSFAVVVGATDVANYLSMRDDGQYPTPLWHDASLVLGLIGPALALGFAAWRARGSAVWPATLLLLSLPPLLLTPRYFMPSGDGSTWREPRAIVPPGWVWPGLSLEALVTGTLLAATLWWALWRRSSSRGDERDRILLLDS